MYKTIILNLKKYVACLKHENYKNMKKQFIENLQKTRKPLKNSMNIQKILITICLKIARGIRISLEKSMKNRKKYKK